MRRKLLTLSLIPVIVILASPAVGGEYSLVETVFDPEPGIVRLHTHAAGLWRVEEFTPAAAFAATVVSVTDGSGVIAERAMYWPRGGPWRGGHGTIGWRP